MAQKVQVVLIDDIDGGDATETVTFGAGRRDVRDRPQRQERRQAAGRVRGVGRQRTPGHRPLGARAARPAGVAAPRAEDSSAIREWAKQTVTQVSERGRISAAVREAYDAAH